MNIPEKLIGAGGGSPSQPSLTDDNLFSKDVAELVLGICEGEIEGLENGMKSFFVGDVPFQNEDGTLNFKTLETPVLYTGADTDPPLVFKLGGESSTDAPNVKLRKDVTITRISPSTLRNKITSIELSVKFDTLFIQEEDGSTFNNTARFQMAIKRASQPDATYQYYRELLTFTLYGKTTSGYVREFVFSNLPPLVDDDWQVKITKFSPDLLGQTGRLDVCEMTLQAVSYVTAVSRSYPRTAVLHIVAETGQEFSTIPDFYGIYLGQKLLVPTNYNGFNRTTGLENPWNGGTFKKEWTNNPAWFAYNMVMNPDWGMIKHFRGMSVNPFDFYEAAQYCDERVPDGKGGTQPRYSFNGVLENPLPAQEQLQNVCGAFNSTIFDGLNGKLHLRVDRWRTPLVLFTPECIVDSFNYTNADIETQYNDVTVSLINPDLDWNVDKRRIADEGSITLKGRIPLEFEALGCTDVHEATRRAYLRLITGQTEITTVSFITTRLGLLLSPFDNIWVADPDMGWGVTGRIAQITGNKLYLRDPVFCDTITTFSMLIQTYEGAIEIFVTPVTAGEAVEFDLFGEPYPSTIFPPQAQFALQQDAGDFGLAKPFRVLKAEEVEGNGDLIRITALEVNRLKYDAADNCQSVGNVPYSFKNAGSPPAPFNLTLLSGTNQLQLNADGSINSRISAAWQFNRNSFIDYFEVQYTQVDNTAWGSVSTTGSQIYLGPVVDGVYYEVAVRSVNRLGKRSSWTRGQILVQGKLAPPSDVTGFSFFTDTAGVHLNWNPIPDLDRKDYEVRVGKTWEEGTPLFVTQETTKNLGTLEPGEYQLWIKARDTSGNVSVNATGLLVEIYEPDRPVVILTYEGTNIVLDWSRPASIYSITSYIIKKGMDLIDAEFLAQVDAQTFRLQVDFAGSTRFWVAAVDSSGAVGLFGYVDFAPAPPVVSNLRVNVLDNNVLLYWQQAQGSFPISFDKIFKGDDFGTAQPVYQAASTFAPVFETQPGTFRYWVVAFDSAGNPSEPKSILASVIQPPDYILYVDRDSDFSGAKTNLYYDAIQKQLIGAVNTTESYEDHFLAHGYTSWQDAIDDGYILFLTPALTSFSYVEEYDYGSLLPSAVLTVLIDRVFISGSMVTENLTISTRELDTDPWTDHPGVYSVMAASARYVKIEYTGTTSGDDALFIINRINFKLDLKKRREERFVDALATDIDGTVVTFDTQFNDVITIVHAPTSPGTQLSAIDFVDAPYPTECKVLLFDLDGNRIDGRVGLTITGY